MKIVVLCCAALAQFAGVSFAQSAADIINVNERSHDFGAVAKSSKSEHRFVLKNPFKTEMRIQSVRASCGCTTPILESQVIKPGESVGLVAHFNTDRFTGDKKATLTVSISQPLFTELQLNVKGYIRSDVVLSPGEAAFGAVPEASDKKLSLTLEYAGRPDWAIVGIACPYTFIQSEFKEISRANGRVRYMIDIFLQGSAPEGYLNNQITVQTNDRRLKSFPIALSVSIEKSMKTSPPSIALGPVKPNEPIQKRITITAKNDFRIMAIESEIAEIRCDLPPDPKRIHMLGVVILPKPSEALIGEVKGKILIKTDSTSDLPVEIPLSFTLETEKFANSPPL
jgi:Protein of unknown function (DUF1573)